MRDLNYNAKLIMEDRVKNGEDVLIGYPRSLELVEDEKKGTDSVKVISEYNNERIWLTAPIDSKLGAALITMFQGVLRVGQECGNSSFSNSQKFYFGKDADGKYIWFNP